MRTKISVALNGIELHSLDEAIILQSLDEATPNWNITAGNRGNKTGQYVNSIEERYREIGITFAIDEKQDLIRRAEILQRVFAWAKAGGDLTVNYRDRQKLRVICTALPAIKTVTKWAETYSITFRAYGIPYWQSMDEESVTVAATASANATLQIRETGGGLLCFTAANASGSTVNTLAIAANNRHYSFANLGLLDGETMRVDYDENGLQRIRIQASGGTWRSVMSKRETTSNDDIILNPGTNTVSMTSGSAVTWRIFTKGRWI